jgi:ATP synthase subunit 6
MVFTSPLEQFNVFPLIPIVVLGRDLSFSNGSLALTLVGLTFWLMFSQIIHHLHKFPRKFQYLAELVYTFIAGIVRQQSGNKGLRYFPVFFSIFFLILFSNLLGLIPFAYTPTANLCITLSLALSCNLAFVIIGFRENGLSFLKLFVPKGGPKFLLPLIVVIEFASYLLRTFSLSIRLFANMMAGHTLLHILSSFVVAFVNSPYFIFSVFPFLLVLTVLALELGIAFLQAYVFLILLFIYLNDSLHPFH